MDPPPNCLTSAPSAQDNVDPFLKEALQNPCHRLTVLRMELDIQRFMRNPDQHQFEFQHFPTSYLRLTAHRVAQHYGLQSVTLDNDADGSGSRVVVRKTTESKNQLVCLSEIGFQPENEKHERIKIAIRSRPRGSAGNGTEVGVKRSPVRTVEERKEEYDRARARIFSCSSSPNLEGLSSQSTDVRNQDESGSGRATTDEPDKTSPTGSSTSRVAIFRDREKDRSDPDYDRSYDRYAKSCAPNLNFGMREFAMHHTPFVHYETGFPQLMGYLPSTQMPVNYAPANPMMSPFCTVGFNQISRDDDSHLHCPSPSLMYAHSFEHLRHVIFQAQSYQQPLSFGYAQNH